MGRSSHLRGTGLRRGTIALAVAQVLLFRPCGTRGDTWRLAADADAPPDTAVSALDAAFVLQAIAGSRQLDATQRLACDVTGDGGLTAVDAALLLQQAVGLGDAPQRAAACAGPWLFLPASTAAAGQRTRNQPAAVYLRTPYQRGSGHWVVSLVVVSEAPFSALDVRLAYDPTRVAIDGVQTAGTASRATVAVRADAGGHIALALAAAEPLTADHHVVSRIRLRADAPPALRIVAADLDESPVLP